MFPQQSLAACDYRRKQLTLPHFFSQVGFIIRLAKTEIRGDHQFTKVQQLADHLAKLRQVLLIDLQEKMLACMWQQIKVGDFSRDTEEKKLLRKRLSSKKQKKLI